MFYIFKYKSGILYIKIINSKKSLVININVTNLQCNSTNKLF